MPHLWRHQSADAFRVSELFQPIAPRITRTLRSRKAQVLGVATRAREREDRRRRQPRGVQ
jgi:hypothetical protein